MTDDRCPTCGGRVRLDERAPRPRCRRCGWVAESQRPAVSSLLVRGVEVIDWLGPHPISRYYMSVDGVAPRDPHPVYLMAVRRSHWRRHGR